VSESLRVIGSLSSAERIHKQHDAYSQDPHTEPKDRFAASGRSVNALMPAISLCAMLFSHTFSAEDGRYIGVCAHDHNNVHWGTATAQTKMTAFEAACARIASDSRLVR
jgi:hypothetical protein